MNDQMTTLGPLYKNLHNCLSVCPINTMGMIQTKLQRSIKDQHGNAPLMLFNSMFIRVHCTIDVGC